MRLVTASVDRLGAAAEAAARFDRAALAVLRLVATCGQAAGGSHAVHAEAAAFLELHAQGLLRVLHNAGSGVHRWGCLRKERSIKPKALHLYPTTNGVNGGASMRGGCKTG